MYLDQKVYNFGIYFLKKQQQQNKLLSVKFQNSSQTAEKYTKLLIKYHVLFSLNDIQIYHFYGDCQINKQIDKQTHTF